MLLTDSIRRMYSLDTLDPRFLTTSTSTSDASATSRRNSSRIPEKLQVLDDGESSGPAQRLPGANPSRWKTPEYYFYYFTFFGALAWMFKVAMDVSREDHPEYPKYSYLLTPGWMAGRKVDNSDMQYQLFRDRVSYMLALLICHPLLRRAYNYIYPIRQDEASQSLNPPQDGSASSPTFFTSAAAADERLEQRVYFDVRFGLLFVCVLHGFSILKILLILYINYTLATRLPKDKIPVATWVFNIGILFANELADGYRFASVGQLLAPGSAEAGGVWGSWLDRHGGLISRWHILFNITVLRLISFNLDYYWSLQARGGSPLEKKQLDPATLSDKDRVKVPAKAKDYSFRNYLAYILYSPLYLAGPIITFNDFTHQLRYISPGITTNRTFLYGVRFLLCLLSMEFLLHFIYAVAICKAQPAWEVYTPYQLSMLGYFNLHIIWLKLLLPWRFFRLWSLVDQIDPPENVIRCMSDNFSMITFWRGWHRSFNRWIVRYIYVPLGGSPRPGEAVAWPKLRAGLNLTAVFTFVALWHDINLKLLAWGWLICLFVLPEVIGKLIFPKRRWENSPTAYRLLTGLGCVLNVLMLMVANLVGFAIGIDGFLGLIRNILGSTTGFYFMTMACSAIFVAVQLMFEVRQHEFRKGINLKC